MSERANARRVPLSLTISGIARRALDMRAMSEGHRYPAAFAASLLEKAILAPPATEPAPFEARLTLTEPEAYGVATCLIPIPGLAARMLAELTKRGASRERCAEILDALGLDMPPAPPVTTGGAR